MKNLIQTTINPVVILKMPMMKVMMVLSFNHPPMDNCKQIRIVSLFKAL